MSATTVKVTRLLFTSPSIVWQAQTAFEQLASVKRLPNYLLIVSNAGTSFA